MDGIGVLDGCVGQRELAFVACLVCQYADEDEQDDGEAADGVCCDEVSGGKTRREDGPQRARWDGCRGTEDGAGQQEGVVIERCLHPVCERVNQSQRHAPTTERPSVREAVQIERRARWQSEAVGTRLGGSCRRVA